MTARINRRALAAGLLAASAAPAAASTPYFASSPALRGDNTARLPDHAALWSRMPLPFTPAEAWHLLSPTTQAEIGADGILLGSISPLKLNGVRACTYRPNSGWPLLYEEYKDLPTEKAARAWVEHRIDTRVSTETEQPSITLGSDAPP
ncbi:hypothetical protein MKK65_22535 [Methylobacterium sp. J-001]|uniref:hypothetical protein n=1 Tax=Methylobacterium sp. J-001 TaxID=2836609 RepID=UPI001FB90867|nr:hypothetical protein [Methylobacterium sp. J-001]MCJ2119312.1 hypothetical protein [Methylobacterium sp. J-001]